MAIPPPEPMRWPTTLAVTDVQWQLENVSRNGGPSISGEDQVAYGGSMSRWTLSLTVVVGSRTEIKCYRALMAALQGRANTILMPAFELNWSPASQAYGVTFNVCTFDDGATFADGSYFEMTGTYAYLAFAANELDSTIYITASPYVPTPGQYIGFNDDDGNHDFHVIACKSGPDGRAYMIEPAMRRRYESSQAILCERPQCEMRLASDTEGQLTISREQYQTPTLKFVEVF